MASTWRESLAQCAGFINGEGNIRFNTVKCAGRSRIYGCPIIQIGQVDRWILDRVADVLKVGTVRGPYQKANRKDKDYFAYEVSGFEKVQYVVGLLWKWLSPLKRDQAKHTFSQAKQYALRPLLKPGPKPKGELYA